MWGSAIAAQGKPTYRLPEATVASLRDAVAGTVVTPEDETYHGARRVWNGLVNRYPSAIVRCRGVSDVVAAVDASRAHDLPVAVRGGGHHVAGNGVVDDGLVVDLSEMRSVRVDPERRTARVAAGAKIGDVIRETQQFGLAAPSGTSADVGVAGSSLGGGIGWLRRKHGLAIDALRSVDVVTADGECLTASETGDQDLFWGVRGSGWTLGVATSFEFDLYPVGPEVTSVMVFYDDDPAVLRAYRDWTEESPDEACSMAFLTRAPQGDDVPAASRGEPAVGVMACYVGSVADGTNVLQPLRELSDPLVDYSEPTTYQKLHDLGGAYPHGRRYYWKSHFLPSLTDDCIASLREHAATAPSRHSGLTLWQLGGAMSRIAEDETAFDGRNADFLLSVEAAWDDPTTTAENLSWARGAWEAIRPHASGGMYVNFPGLGEEGDDIVRAGAGSNYDRLVDLRERFDPDRRFRIQPVIENPDGDTP